MMFIDVLDKLSKQWLQKVFVFFCNKFLHVVDAFIIFFPFSLLLKHSRLLPAE